jgi:hypothetical protein
MVVMVTTLQPELVAVVVVELEPLEEMQEAMTPDPQVQAETVYNQILPDLQFIMPVAAVAEYM